MKIITNNNDSELELYNCIKKILFKIRYCKSSSSFESLTEELNSLYLLCEEFDLYNCPQAENYISRGITTDSNNIKKRFYMKEAKTFYKYVMDNIDHFIDFSSMADLFENFYFDKDLTKPATTINLKKSLIYAKEFMKNFDERFIKNFEQVENSKHILIQNKTNFEPYDAVFIPTKYVEVPYMGFFISENIDDAASFIHETAHMINYNYEKNNTKMRNYPNFFHEVYSHFCQFVFYDYMKKKKVFNQDIDNSFKDDLSFLSTCLANINYSLQNGEEEICYEDLFYDFEYGFGIAIALKYFDIFKADPEYATYLTNSFIEKSYYYEPIDVLNNFGLDEEELISGDTIKKYIKS